MHTLEQKQNTHIQFSSLQDTSNHLLAFVVVLCHISLKKVSCSFSLKKLLLGLEKDLNLLLEKAASCEGSLPLKKDGWSQQQEEASWVWDHNWQKDGAEAVQAMVCPAAGWPSCDQQSWNGSSARSLEKGNWKCPDATCSAWKSWEAEQETWENWPQEPHPWRVGKSFWEEAQAYQLGSGWSWEESEGQAGSLKKELAEKQGTANTGSSSSAGPPVGPSLKKDGTESLKKDSEPAALKKGTKPVVIIDWHNTLEINDLLPEDNLAALKKVMEVADVRIISWVNSAARRSSTLQQIRDLIPQGTLKKVKSYQTIWYKCGEGGKVHWATYYKAETIFDDQPAVCEEARDWGLVSFPIAGNKPHKGSCFWTFAEAAEAFLKGFDSAAPWKRSGPKGAPEPWKRPWPAIPWKR